MRSISAGLTKEEQIPEETTRWNRRESGTFSNVACFYSDRLGIVATPAVESIGTRAGQNIPRGQIGTKNEQER